MPSKIVTDLFYHHHTRNQHFINSNQATLLTTSLLEGYKGIFRGLHSFPSHSDYSHLTFVLLTFPYPSIQNTHSSYRVASLSGQSFFLSKISPSKRMAGRRAGLAAQTSRTRRWWATAAVIDEECRKESADGTQWSGGYFQSCSHTSLTHGKHKKGTSFSVCNSAFKTGLMLQK